MKINCLCSPVAHTPAKLISCWLGLHENDAFSKGIYSLVAFEDTNIMMKAGGAPFIKTAGLVGSFLC